MQMKQEDVERIESYLLWELGEDEREAVQRRILEEEDFFQLVAHTETDLIDAYVRKDLPEARLERIEQRLLQTPRNQERLRFAQALQARTLRSRSQSSTAVGKWWLGIAAVLAAALIGWTIWERQGVDPPPEALRSRPAALETLRLSLSGRALRGQEEVQQARLSESVGTLELRLRLDPADAHDRYHATVQSPEGETLESLQGLQASGDPQGRFVALTLSAPPLAEGRYEVELQGQDDENPPVLLDFYYFDLTRH